MQNKKGISLIVLVITIIVMIIIAAAIIISLNNTGIIGNANKAVNETNEKTVQEIANLAWGEAYASGVRDEVGLKSAVEKALTDNGLKKEDYGIVVDQKGVDIAKGWLQTENRKVIKGTQVLNIGDKINYDETEGGKITGLTDVEWAILGAENGKLIIMSMQDVADKDFNLNSTLAGGEDEYINGIDDLNEICAPYGKGVGAEYARSITIDDVDRVTGYDKTKYVSDRGKYKQTVTLYWDNTEGKEKYPYYVSSTGATGNVTREHTKFVWYDGTSWQEQSMPTGITEKKKIITLTDECYAYDGLDDTNLTQNDKAYIMIFGENKENTYALASRFVAWMTDCVKWKYHMINTGKIMNSYTVVSNGENGSFNRKVRAVVVLKQDAKIGGSSTDGYTIS